MAIGSQTPMDKSPEGHVLSAGTEGMQKVVALAPEICGAATVRVSGVDLCM